MPACIQFYQSLLLIPSVLKIPEYDITCSIQVEASDFMVGVFFLQFSDSNILHSICYYSCKLKPHQQAYSISCVFFMVFNNLT